MKKVFLICILVLSVFLSLRLCSAGTGTEVYVNPELSEVNIGEEFTVNIDIETTEDVFAVEFSLYFDPSIIKVEKIIEGDFLNEGGAPIYNVSTINNVSGKIEFACTRFNTKSGVTGSGTLSVIKFIGEGAGSSAIHLQKVVVVDSNINELTVSANDGSVNVNTPPEMHPIGDRTVQEAELLEFQVSANDPDNGSLIYWAENLPIGALFVDKTFSWTPGYNQSGIYNLTFHVSDGTSQDSEAIHINVTDFNRAPIIDVFLPVRTILKTRNGYAIRFNHSSHDPDGKNLEYSWNLDNTTMETTKGLLFLPDAGDIGYHKILLEVFDDCGAEASHSWDIDVKLNGDVKIDCIVDISDLASVGKAYGSASGDPEWNSNADIFPAPQPNGTYEGDGYINILDLATVGLNYGNHCE